MSARHMRLGFAAAFMAVGLVYVAVFVVPPLLSLFIDDLGLSHSQAGLLMSVFLIAYALTSPLTGPLVGRFGAVWVMAAGLLVCAGSTFLFAASDSLAVFLVARAGVGVGTALVYAPGIGFVASLLPPRLVSTGVGLYLTGLSVGVTVTFLLTSWLESRLEWQGPFWVFGAVILAGVLLFLAMALPAARSLPRPQALAGRERAALGSNRAFLAICASLFAAMFVAYGIFTWIPPFLDEEGGFSAGQIRLAITLAVALGIPVTPLVGWLADRTGRPLAVAAAFIGLALTVSVLAATGAVSFGVALAITIATTAGVTGGLIPLFTLPATVVTSGAADRANGIATASAMTGAIASTYLGGELVETSGGYGLAFGVYAVATALAVAVLFPWTSVVMRRRAAAAV